MGITIDDGRGTGQSAGVSISGNRLDVSSRSDSRIYYVSRDNGDAYSWSSGTYDGAAGDTVLSVKNTSTTQKLYVREIILSSDVETRVTIYCPSTVYTSAGTAITGTNLNRTSGNTASATAIRDETGNTAQENIVWSGEIQATSGYYDVDFHDSIILGQGHSINIDYAADFGACDVTIIGFYDVE